jgi:hypothetical protein
MCGLRENCCQNGRNQVALLHRRRVDDWELDLELGELQGEMWGSRHGEFRANTNPY